MESLIITMFFIGDPVFSVVVIITVTLLSVLKFYSVSLLFLTRDQGKIFTSKLKACYYSREKVLWHFTFFSLNHSLFLGQNLSTFWLIYLNNENFEVYFTSGTVMSCSRVRRVWFTWALDSRVCSYNDHVQEGAMLRVKASHLSIGSVKPTFLTLERMIVVVLAFHTGGGVWLNHDFLCMKNSDF